MPTRATTRSAATPAKAEAAPIRPTRTTRTPAKSKQPVVAKPQPEDELANEMDRVLKVSDPEPQAKARQTAASSTKVGPKEPTTKASVSRKPPVGQPTLKPTAARSARTVGSDEPQVSAATKRTAKPATAAVPPARVRAGPSKSATVSRSRQSQSPTGDRSTGSLDKVAPARSAPRPVATTGQSSGASRTSMASTSSGPVPRTTPALNAAKSTGPTPTASSSSIKTVAATRPRVSLRGKERELVVHDLPVSDFPWLDMSNDLSISDRAQQAMAIVKASVTTLASASKAGYVYGIEKDEWTTERIDKEMAVCEAAIGVLRELGVKGLLGTKTMEVEKAAQAVIAKSISLSMPRRAFQQLALSRTSLMRLYGAPDSTAPIATLAVESPETKRIPEEWLLAPWLPQPIDVSALSDVQRTLCFQQVVASWTCFVSLEGYGYDLPVFTEIMPKASRKPDGWLNAFSLALSLPTSASFSLVSFLSRRLNTIPMAAPHWPHVYLVTMQAVLCAAGADSSPDPSTGSPPVQTRRAPSAVWETVKKWIVAYVGKPDSTGDRQAVASRLLSDLVCWADEVISTREEKRESWYSGEHWTALHHLWIDLARKSKDRDGLDRAMANMTGSLVIDPAPAYNLSSSGWANAASPEEAMTRLSKLFAQLGALEALPPVLDNSSTASALTTLAQTEWDLFGYSLGALADDDAGRQCFARSFRATERARRVVTGWLQQCTKADQDLVAACRQWLVALAINIEDGLRATCLQAEREYDSLVGSCIGCVNVLVRHHTTAAQPIETGDMLDRGRRMCLRAMSAQVRSEGLRSLSHAAYAYAYELNGRQSWQDALAIIALSIELSDLAITNVEDKAQLATEPWQDLIDRGGSKLEMMGTVYYTLDRKEDAIKAICNSLTVQHPTTLSAIAAADDSTNPTALLAKLPRLNSTIGRLAKYLCGDLDPVNPGVLDQRIKTLIDTLNGSKVPATTANWMIERLLDSVLLRAVKPDALETVYRIAEALLARLNNEQAAQAARIASQLMLLISSHGLHQDKFDELAERAEASMTYLRSQDGADSTLIAEYHAVINMTRAFHAYQVEEDPTTIVLSLSTGAIEELRGLLVPPSQPREQSVNTAGASTVKARSSRATKTPAKPSEPVNGAKRVARSASASTPSKSKTASTATGAQRRRSSLIPIASFRDITRLTSLLTSLISLLGLLGHVLAKVDALKCLRAMLRHREDCLNDYVSHSVELATLYSKLGKYSRASTVFAQALRTISDYPTGATMPTQVEAQIRFCEHLTSIGELEKAKLAYADAQRLHGLIEEEVPVLYRDRVTAKCASHSRLALAYRALASIRLAEDNASEAIRLLRTVVALRSRCVSNMALLAVATPSAGDKTPPATAEASPFIAPPSDPTKTGANEPSKDEVAASNRTTIHPFANKFLHGLQWSSAEHVMDAYIDLASAYAQRGSAYDAKFYLTYAEILSRTVRSAALSARTKVKIAALKNRLRQVEDAKNKLLEATTSLAQLEGPDAFDLRSAKGDWLARQDMAQDANIQLEAASKGIHGLDGVFTTADALLPSPRKDGVKRPSLTSSARVAKEPLLPSTLSQVLRQQAWLLRKAGQTKESDELYRQAQTLQTSSDLKAEDAYLVGKIALDNAFSHFKTDLFMSSLTESTIAMPMGSAAAKPDHRQSARHRIQVILDQADQAYRTALSLVAGSGKVEDVRQACLSLALLRAFQTSLGQGSLEVTAVAADLLATSTSVTLHREMLEAIEGKFPDISGEDTAWPPLDGSGEPRVKRSKPAGQSEGDDDEDEDDDLAGEAALVDYWNEVRERYSTNDHLSPERSAYDLSILPKNWAVVSVSVTDDRNTMFISRHQNGHDPIVFCLPLDRQSNRDSDIDPFTFDMGMSELRDIIAASDTCSREAKMMLTNEQKKEWWATKRTLDERMKALIDNVEFCWLGAFKTIFSPKLALTPERLARFRTQIEKVFNLAIFGSAHDTKKAGRVHLNDSLLECFANLPHDSREEEIEDLVYFILDIYQFHGVPVALHELDFEQIVCDLQAPLAELQASLGTVEPPVDGPEHLLLALDKNAQAFPWESIPYLRGRPISRVPSLPILLDQLALGKIMQPGSTRRTVNSRKTYFILNPSGDLMKTQEAFEPLLKDMQERSGWKGIIGDKPTELELSRILRDYDLVLYFGHGGAEQYIRGAKVRTLPKCATTFLWGCSSGKLEDQGDLDVAGTAWNYMMAGCPALTATLWDVTDRDIDRVTQACFDRLGLNAAHIMQQEKPRAEHSKPGFLPISGQGLGMSTVEAVNLSRTDCKMTYLTGAAVVHYGIPVYIY